MLYQLYLGSVFFKENFPKKNGFFIFFGETARSAAIFFGDFCHFFWRNRREAPFFFWFFLEEISREAPIFFGGFCHFFWRNRREAPISPKKIKFGRKPFFFGEKSRFFLRKTIFWGIFFGEIGAKRLFFFDFFWENRREAAHFFWGFFLGEFKFQKNPFFLGKSPKP